jgi:peptidoglycan/LPS O-acetylase OafA/YrhL
LSAPRNTQLDGWRALAVFGVMGQHWAPPGWRGSFPFEIGLYFFFILSGYLITRGLLRDREAGAVMHKPWRRMAIRHFLKRRALRILLPCYVAMLFAWIVGAPDIRGHPLYYLTHTVNFHMAGLPDFPSGTAHYWTLAIQVQFYLLWPILIYAAPWRHRMPILIAVTLMGPLSRAILVNYFPEILRPGAITTSTLDYFGAGALLALVIDRGMKPGDRRLSIAAWAALAPYVILYQLDRSGRPLPGICHFQQTFLSVACAGLISATLGGLRGPLGKLLEFPFIQQIGRLSYGLYLFHTPMPLLLGFILPWLWLPQVPLGIRIVVFFFASWGAAWLCWRYLETHLDRFRRQTTVEAPRP